MKAVVRLSCTDCLEGTEAVIAEGKAVVRDDILHYKEQDTGALHTVRFGEDTIEIIRKGDAVTTIVLPREGTGTCTVRSQYGTMVMDAGLIRYFRGNNEWTVEYRLLADGTAVAHRIMHWQIRIYS